MSLSQLSKRILKLRKEHKMTQGALAKKVGVSTTAISQFEKGSSGPSLETLTKLSDALGEDLRELVPRIGRFPILSTENNIDVPIISGNQYNRLQWDYLRRDESDLPSAKEEANYINSRTAYAYESLSLPPSLLEKGQHLVYPMPGNQMAPVFEKGDLLLCSLIEDRNEWREMGEDTDDFEAIDVLPVYVVEVWKEKERVIHFGRFSINEKRQTLRCYLDDRSMPYRIPFADIKGLWKFRWCLTSRYHNRTQSLLDRIRELEYRVAKLSSGGPLSEHSDNSPAYRTFRERLSEIIIGQQIAEGEFLKGDYIDLANDKEVQELYVREYGPIQNHQGYMKSMEGIILEMVRKLSPEVQRKIHGESIIKRKTKGFSGDFRDDLKNLIQSQITKREDIDKLDFIELANDERVREFYVNEYGPITNNKTYISDALHTMKSVAFEVTLGLPYPEVQGIEQTGQNSLT